MISHSAHPSIPAIDRELLRTRLARGDDFKLVMVGSDFAFRAKHIPRSLHFATSAETFAALRESDDIVVYCSNLDCHASVALAQKLLDHGYGRVSHYPGGIIDWEAAGMPLEGEWAPPPGAP